MSNEESTVPLAQDHTQQETLPSAASPATIHPACASFHRLPLEVAPGSIQQVGNALFVLWIKIAGTLLAARLLFLIWQVVVLLIITLMLVATLNPLVRRLQKRLKRAYAISIVVFGIIATSGGLLVLMIPPLVLQRADEIIR